MNAETYPAIPLGAGQTTGWKDIAIKDIGDRDPLVALGALSPKAGIIATSSVYFGEDTNSPYAKKTNRLMGSLLTLFARQSTAQRLLDAERHLPAYHHLLVFDAYRPYEVQKSLYDFYKQKLSEKYPGKSNELLDLETQKYVSLPTRDRTRPSPHNTGGTVDVVIVKLDHAREEELLKIRSQLDDTALDAAKRMSLTVQLWTIMRNHADMLDFGTAFDHGGEKSALAYYESKIAKGETLNHNDLRACNNRRLLFKVMSEAGFAPYFAEWWHFNAPETQMGAATTGRTVATFGPITLNQENKVHERTRLKIWPTMRKASDPLRTDYWPTEIIAPSKDSL